MDLWTDHFCEHRIYFAHCWPLTTLQLPVLTLCRPFGQFCSAPPPLCSERSRTTTLTFLTKKFWTISPQPFGENVIVLPTQCSLPLQQLSTTQRPQLLFGCWKNPRSKSRSRYPAANFKWSEMYVIGSLADTDRYYRLPRITSFRYKCENPQWIWWVIPVVDNLCNYKYPQRYRYR